MNPALLTSATSARTNGQTGDAATPQADALSAFVAANWHEDIRRRLAATYERTRGSAAIEEAVSHALEKAVTHLQATSGRQVYAFVLTAAERRLLDGLKSERRAGARGWSNRTDESALDAAPTHATASPEEELTATSADAVAHEAARALLDDLETATAPPGLDERTLQVLILSHLEGLTYGEISERTGLTHKQARTSLARGNAYLHDRYIEIETAVQSDCGPSRRAVMRLAFDLAHGREASRAQAHLRHCLVCERQLKRAQAFRRSAAALLPLPVLPAQTADGGRLAAWVDSVTAGVGRLLGQGQEAAQTGLVAGVGRAASPPVTAGLAKLAAVCLAGGAIAGSCLSVSSPERTDAPRHVQGLHATTAATRSGRTELVPESHRPLPSSGRSPSRPASPATSTSSRSKAKQTSAQPDEFFAADAGRAKPSVPAASTADNGESAAGTNAPSSSRPSRSQPAEFPVF